MLDRLDRDFYVLARTQNSYVRYCPRYIHSFLLWVPRKLLEAQQLGWKYHNVPDRLRRCRHSRGMMQVEVAELAGISRASCIDIAYGITQHSPAPMMERLADFYGVPITLWTSSAASFTMDRRTVSVHIVRAWALVRGPLPEQPVSPLLAGMGIRGKANQPEILGGIF